MHHNNALAHTSLTVHELWAKHKMTVITQLAYSPDLAPADRFWFLRLKSILEGGRFWQ
jgi:hypothetical protein